MTRNAATPQPRTHWKMIAWALPAPWWSSYLASLNHRCWPMLILILIGRDLASSGFWR